MEYGQRLRAHNSADVRVLKAQLDVIADVVHGAQISAPIWGFVIAAVGSNAFGHFAQTPLRLSLIVAIAIIFASLIAVHLVTLYRRETAGPVPSENLEAWFPRFVAVQLLTGAAWALIPWLLWTPGDEVNHMVLATWVGCALGSIAINRAMHADMVAAGLLPLGISSMLRFLCGDSAFDIGAGLFMPLLALQFYIAVRRMTHRSDADSRLRFDVEDLARELEEARDDALRKRFEAETANSSKTAFLANMSHELRTPLNAILGFSEIIAKECFGDVGSPRYREYAADIHSSGSHLLSLINDLLDVAKIEAGRMEIEPGVLDVRRTFETALKIIGAKARERRQDLAIEIDPSAPPLFADERAVKQILINLVSNAVKFSPEGGRITVLGMRSRCGDFQIVVEDDGPGIPREKLDKIFKPFSQVDNRYDRQGGGTGLGLALVRGLAELHQGRAWLESEPGKGCRAYVVLPTTEAARSAAA